MSATVRGSPTAANAVGFFFWGGWQVIVPFLSLYAASLGADAATVGLVLGSYQIVPLLLAIPTGAFTERWGSGRMMLTGCASGMLGLAVLLTGAGLPAFIAGLVIIGLAHLAVNISTQVEMLLGSNPKQLVRLIGMSFFFTTVAQVVGPVIGAALVRGTEYRPAFIAAALMSLVAMLFTFAPARRRPPRGAVVSPPPALLTAIDVMRKKPAVRAGLLTHLTGDIAFMTWNSFFPLLLLAKQFGPGDIAFFFSVRALASTVIRLFVGSPRLLAGRMPLLYGCLTVSASTLALMPLVQSRPAMVAVVAIYGVANGIIFPISAAVSAAGFPPGAAGVGVGIRTTMSRLGAIFGPILAGFIAQNFRLEAAFWTVSLIFGGTILFYLGAPARAIATAAAREAREHARKPATAGSGP